MDNHTDSTHIATQETIVKSCFSYVREAHAVVLGVVQIVQELQHEHARPEREVADNVCGEDVERNRENVRNSAEMWTWQR
jgi:hypothetical protein